MSYLAFYNICTEVNINSYKINWPKTHQYAALTGSMAELTTKHRVTLNVAAALHILDSRNVSLFFLFVPACKSASETKVISHAVRQPVFLRSMSAPSDLEMIGNEDLEFTRANQR